MVSQDGVWSTPTWQITEVTRPLLSIGEISDEGKVIAFGSRGGVIFDIQTQEGEAFPRINGTYEVERCLPPAPLVANAQAFVRPA